MTEDKVDLIISTSRYVEKLFLRDEIKRLNSGIEYKALHQLDCVREALAYRYFELLNSSYELYKSKSLIAGLCLARSTQETLATLLYINIKLEKFLNGKDVVSLLKCIERLHVGYSQHNRNLTVKVKSFNVMNFIEESDKKIKNFRSLYDSLSEYSHPNYRGTASAYSLFPDSHMSVKYTKEYGQRNTALFDKLGSSLIAFVQIYLSVMNNYEETLYKKALNIFIEKHKTGNLQKDIDIWLSSN
ncbi:hypothetical protein [Photobacterium phosphoreum]|uniref:hypothetical protein n=1 Tax=Photobacterium phosphoreum TaxID=659 RepID=UPI001E49CB5A|nr:hypothetical protein [Photobacterium phosphoreum]MCD9512762.1 hypothetical protein [Photobacterium phosphoreum]